MPSATIPRAVTQQEAAEALRRQLGSSYKIAPHSAGKLTVSRAGLEFATVHLTQGANTTTFRVHGGGLIINRIVNEFAIARTVTAAIKESLGPPPAS